MNQSCIAAGAEITPGRYAWSLLGAGRRHETWLAWDERLWAPVVVKRVDAAHTEFLPAYEAIAREAGFLRRLNHPRIPRLLDHQESDGFLVCEYVEGETLAAVLGDGAMSPIDAVLLAMQIASVLRMMHQQGLVHFDVTPGNLLLAEGRPVVIDLGLTRHVGWRSPDHLVRGTRGYVAPERYDLARADPAMDVFGLGAVMFELLTGDSAYDTATTEADLSQRRPARESRGPADVDPRIPLPLDRLVRRCLDPDPWRRPSATALLIELAALLPPDEAPSWPAWAGRLLYGS
jgi:serine/threonine protein kinase